MQHMQKKRKCHIGNPFCIFFAGLLITVLVNLPYLILNRNMLAIIHDEFDYDVVAYMFRARNLFGSRIEELFNGCSAICMTPSAFLFTLPYCFFSADIAFFLDYMLIILIAFSGMFLIIHKLLQNDWIAILVSVFFSILPFYSVFGLNVMGQPLLFYFFLELWDPSKESIKYKTWFYAGIFLFGLSSSPAQVGYADLIVLFFVALFGCFKKKSIGWFLGGIIILGLSYLITSWQLLFSFLGLSTSGFVSHRSEWVVSANSIGVWKSFKDMFLNGMYHSASNHRRMVLPVTLTLFFSLLFYQKLEKTEKKRAVQMLFLYSFAILIALFYAFWHSYRFSNFRNQYGGVLLQFQADRFYWLYPCIWFLLFAYALYFISVLCKKTILLKYALLITVSIWNFVFIWNGSSLKENTKMLLLPDYQNPKYASVSSFYQEDLFREIEKSIGKPKSSYRVVSVGLYPSIPLYNGFYCLDGYSNNYDVEYKHVFRKAIAEELEKDQIIKKYFDNWGSRCYVFSSELLTNYYFDKNDQTTINSLSIDYKRLKTMGCEYVFSGVEILDNNGIELMGTFDSTDSYYRVFLYHII